MLLIVVMTAQMLIGNKKVASMMETRSKACLMAKENFGSLKAIGTKENS